MRHTQTIHLDHGLHCIRTQWTVDSESENLKQNYMNYT